MPSHHPVIDILKALVRIPSLSGKEGPAADLIEALVQDAGVSVERFEDNVYFWIGEGPDLLLLNSHLDVVPPSPNHPYDPFTPTEVDGYLYGRGTVDAKASGAAMTMALLELAEAGWTPPPHGKVMVALTVCEETGGTDNGLQKLRPHLPKPSAALVGEPTNLQPCVAQKGLLILHLTANGQTAHAARAHLGDNAIVKAARDIQTLSAFSFDREDPFLGKPTLTVTMIEGGTARNVVPGSCSYFLDIRSTPAYTHEEITALVEAAVASEVNVHSKRIVPVSTDLSERIVQASLQATRGTPFGSPTASDWLFLQDVPTVKIGPGTSQLSHTADEHIALSEVVRAVEVYGDIIQSYFD